METEETSCHYLIDTLPARAAALRAEILGGRIASRGERRESKRKTEEADKKKITIGKLWEEYQLLNSSKRTLITDQYNFKNHLTEFADKKPQDIQTIDVLKLRKKLELKNYSAAQLSTY